MTLHGTFAFVLLTAVAASNAARAEAFQSYATVINVQPIMHTTYTPVTRTLCREPDSRAHVSRPVAATIGADIREQKRAWQAQTVCTTVTEQQSRDEVTAYRVTFRYRGQTKTTRLSYHPGERIAVNVRVSPAP